MKKRKFITRYITLVGITQRTLVNDFWLTVNQLINGGIRAIMLREKDVDGMSLLELAIPLKKLCDMHDVALIINGRVDVASHVGADGVHLGYGAPPLHDVRKEVGNDLWIGVSAHMGDNLERLKHEGADYATYSPIFQPISKANDQEPVGLERLARAAKKGLPLIALGGINVSNAKACLKAGAVGVAGIGSLFGATDPEAAARNLLAELDKPEKMGGESSHP